MATKMPYLKCNFLLSGYYTTNGWTNILVGSMNTTNPTARSAHAFLEFWDNLFDVFVACFLLLWGNNPTDPFIARQRREASP